MSYYNNPPELHYANINFTCEKCEQLNELGKIEVDPDGYAGQFECQAEVIDDSNSQQVGEKQIQKTTGSQPFICGHINEVYEDDEIDRLT